MPKIPVFATFAPAAILVPMPTLEINAPQPWLISQTENVAEVNRRLGIRRKNLTADDEKLYENALVIELRARGHTVEQQREYPVHYRGQFIGKLVPDLIVDGKVITDPKVATAFNDTHVAQMLGYLNITGLQVALLLNFKEYKLDWKRVVNERRNRTADDADNTDKK